jgi:glycosyltransferase involved in cell wall biosynthesis
MNLDKTLIFIDNTNELDKLSKNLINSPEAKIFSFNITVHKFLEDKKIEHEIAESYLSKEDYFKIFDTTVSFWEWHKSKSIEQEFQYENVNILGLLNTAEFHHFLIREHYKFFIIKRIIGKEKPDKIFANNHIKNIISELSNNNHISINQIDTKKYNFLMYWDKIPYEFHLGKVPISIQLSRKNYQRIKKFFESIICKLFSLDLKPNDNKKTILFVEFNPLQYSELFENLKNCEGIVSLLNYRRPAVWNMGSLNFLRKSNCKLIRMENFLNTSDKKLISDLVVDYLEKLERLWAGDYLKNKFVVEGITIWPLVKEILFETFRKRIYEYISLIFFSKKILTKTNVGCIVTLNLFGESEKAILNLNKNKKPSVLLEHGFTNYVPEISRFDITNGLSIFKDKIAVWGNIQKQYLVNVLKIPEKKILIVGSPRHDKFFKQRISTNKDSVRTVLITPGLFNPTFAQSSTFSYLRLENLLKRTFKIFESFENIKLIVKLHPAKYDSEYIKKLINQLNPNITIYHTEPIQKILEDCDTVLNIHTEVFPSTVLLESLIMGKPIMNISLVDENYNFQFIKDNAVMQITDKSDLEKHFKTILYDENIRKELIENGQKHLQSYLSNQGKASKHFAEILNSL